MDQEEAEASAEADQEEAEVALEEVVTTDRIITDRFSLEDLARDIMAAAVSEAFWVCCFCPL